MLPISPFNKWRFLTSVSFLVTTAFIALVIVRYCRQFIVPESEVAEAQEDEHQALVPAEANPEDQQALVVAEPNRQP